MSGYMNAATARELANKARSIDGPYMRVETDKILKVIDLAARSGNESMTTSSISEVTRQRLEALDYKVTWTEGYDQCEPGYTTIYW